MPRTQGEGKSREIVYVRHARKQFFFLDCIKFHSADTNIFVLYPVRKMFPPDHCPEHIASLRGHQLKHNEDVLDALVCLYIAGLYQSGHPQKIFGDAAEGYVVVPDYGNLHS